MGRKKINIARIAEERNRHVTFQKRKSGLLKKAIELSILCDSEIAVLIFSPAGSPGPPKLFDYSSTSLTTSLHRLASFSGVRETRDNASLADGEASQAEVLPGAGLAAVAAAAAANVPALPVARGEEDDGGRGRGRWEGEVPGKAARPAAGQAPGQAPWGMSMERGGAGGGGGGGGREFGYAPPVSGRRQYGYQVRDDGGLGESAFIPQNVGGLSNVTAENAESGGGGGGGIDAARIPAGDKTNGKVLAPAAIATAAASGGGADSKGSPSLRQATAQESSTGDRGSGPAPKYKRLRVLIPSTIIASKAGQAAQAQAQVEAQHHQQQHQHQQQQQMHAVAVGADIRAAAPNQPKLPSPTTTNPRWHPWGMLPSGLAGASSTLPIPHPGSSRPGHAPGGIAPQHAPGGGEQPLWTPHGGDFPTDPLFTPKGGIGGTAFPPLPSPSHAGLLPFPSARASGGILGGGGNIGGGASGQALGHSRLGGGGMPSMPLGVPEPGLGSASHPAHQQHLSAASILGKRPLTASIGNALSTGATDLGEGHTR